MPSLPAPIVTDSSEKRLDARGRVWRCWWSRTRRDVHAGDFVVGVERQHNVERRSLELVGIDHRDVPVACGTDPLADDRRAELGGYLSTFPASRRSSTRVA
jgi:hypothetical protein